MSFANRFESVDLPKIERAKVTWSEAVAHAMSILARQTQLTGTWNSSIQTFKDGDDIVIGPDTTILKNNPLINSSLDDGDYTVMFTEKRSGEVHTKNGNKVTLPKNFYLKSPGAIAKMVGEVTDFL